MTNSIEIKGKKLNDGYRRIFRIIWGWQNHISAIVPLPYLMIEIKPFRLRFEWLKFILQIIKTKHFETES